MLKALRYALAAICLTASVACLALWWRSASHWDILEKPNGTQPGCGRIFQSVDGMLLVELDHTYNFDPNEKRMYVLTSHAVAPFRRNVFERIEKHGRFHVRGMSGHFPLWYPALVFALAAVAALRIGRRFTLRSALVGMSVVAALLGMVVAL